MEKWRILYKYIVAYRSYLTLAVVLFILIAFAVNFGQRVETLDVIGNKLSKVDNIDKTTMETYKLILETKKAQDSMRIIVEHLPTGPPLHAKDISKITRNFGYNYDPILKLWKFHAADDFAVKPGTIVYATASGIVIKSEMNASLGKYITINHGTGYTTGYAHLSSIDALPGYNIKKGDPIGIAGNTGWSTGTHLHYWIDYEGTKIDPSLLIQL
jgi:murein DD-endopeptidase MepM/ murein hydrolase activator NlpD